MNLQEPGRLWVVSCKFCRSLDGSEYSGERRRFVSTSSARADQPEAPAGTSGRSDQLESAGYVASRRALSPTRIPEWFRSYSINDAAKTLAPIWGLDATTIERANARSSYLVRAVVAQNYSEQQIIAVAFYKNGLLPARVETNQAQLLDFAAKRALSF